MNREQWWRVLDKRLRVLLDETRPDPSEGVDILRAIAVEPGSGLVEIADGVWSVRRDGGWGSTG
ncbi:hypothetical protein [Actinoplanes palleronii]|uniref:Uncharacterized protein n=1 Tax=Actinoplanes palleronii TaxID=113570 RepID=A0ABQ4BSW1_9ACTN|nr:hypothetical protein [Actinoplanes palleronii]GIE73769.1 hypothetical protein Apa02nite_098770 [Actinoplanes palleronii]